MYGRGVVTDPILERIVREFGEALAADDYRHADVLLSAAFIRADQLVRVPPDDDAS